MGASKQSILKTAAVTLVEILSSKYMKKLGAQYLLAEEGACGILGSIFGMPAKVASILGSLVTNTTILKILTFSLAGVAIIVVVMYARGYGQYKICTRNRGDIVDQGIVGREEIENLPEFQPISMSKSQFEEIKQLTKGGFKETIKKISCPFTKEVMRQPRRMKCCKDQLHRKTQQFQTNYTCAEKIIIQDELSKTGRCIFCKRHADYTYIQEDQPMECMIQGFRHKLIKVYKSANAQQKLTWQKLIDHHLGKSYTQKHLKHFEFNKQNNIDDH